MQELQFGTGVCEYRINGRGVLRFNPTDPGLYGRYMKFYGGLEKALGRLKAAKSKAGKPEAMLAEAERLDGEMKAGLRQVFGTENDFEEILQGLNVMAITEEGTTVLESLLDALLPVIEASARQRQAQLQKKADEAVRIAGEKRRQRGDGGV